MLVYLFPSFIFSPLEMMRERDHFYLYSTALLLAGGFHSKSFGTLERPEGRFHPHIPKHICTVLAQQLENYRGIATSRVFNCGQRIQYGTKLSLTRTLDLQIVCGLLNIQNSLECSVFVHEFSWCLFNPRIRNSFKKHLFMS